MVELIVTITVLLLVGVAETIHAARCRKIARLAFGPRQSPRPWATVAPWLRVAAAAAVGAVVAVVVAAPVAWETPVDDVAVGSDTSAGGFLLSSISRFLLRARSLRERGLSTSSPSFLYLLREKLTESLNSLDAGV